MKKFFLFSLIAFFSAFVFAVDNSPFITPHGNVESYTETNFEISTKFGDYYRTPSSKYKHTLNSEGLEVESIEYSATNQIVNRTEYKYTANGKLSSQTCYDDRGNVFWKIISTFDSQGNKTEDSEYDGKNNLTGKTIYRNENENPVEETYYDGNGKLIWKNIYKYNESNQLAESYAYFASGQLDIKKVYKYGKVGNLLEILSYNKLENLIGKEVYVYNDDETINEYAVYGSDNKRRTRIFYKYDDNKNCIKSTTYNIAQKFGTTVNEMVDQSDFEYKYK